MLRIKNLLLLTLFLCVSNSIFAQYPILTPDGSKTFIAVGNGEDEVYMFKEADSSGFLVQQLWKLNTRTATSNFIISFGRYTNPYQKIKLYKIVNGKFYFVIDNFFEGHELWVSDGTASGTKSIYSKGTIYYFFEFNNELIFTVFNNLHPLLSGVYKTDGTINGTVLLKNIHSEIKGLVTYAQILYYNVFKNKLIFIAHKSMPNSFNVISEIWSSDGTASGTIRLDSISGKIDVEGIKIPYYDNSNSLPVLNDFLYFSVNTDKVRLWRTNAEPNSSAFFYELANDNVISPHITYNNKLYFRARTIANGIELHTTDGTISGTGLLKDINLYFQPGYSSNPKNFIAHCNKLFFIATDSIIDFQRIWESNGTTSGTIVNTPIRGFYSNLKRSNNGDLYYTFQNYDNSDDTYTVYKINSLCNTSEVISWNRKDFGRVVEFIFSNSKTLMILEGGTESGYGLYSIDQLTSIQNNSKSKESVTFFPNPTNNKITFSKPLDKVCVKNIFGEIVLSSDHNISELNLEILSPGIYIINMTIGSKTFNKKVYVH